MLCEEGVSPVIATDAMSFDLKSGLAPCRASKVVHGIFTRTGHGLHRGGEAECPGRWPCPSPQPGFEGRGKQSVGRGEERGERVEFGFGIA